MYKHKVLNLHEAVIDFRLSNVESISANNFFKSGSIANNKNYQENSTSKCIYNSSD